LLTYSTTTATGAGGFNAILGASFDYATGEKITVSSVSGDAVAGAAFGQAYFSWGQRLNNPYVKGAVSGFVGGVTGETTEQMLNGEEFNGTDILQQGGFNALGGGLAAPLNGVFRSNYAPIWQGLLTRELRYGVRIGTDTAIRAGFYQQLSQVPQQTIESTGAQAFESAFDVFRNLREPVIQPVKLPASKPTCDPAKDKC
jgi:hypothetical protein